MDSTNTLTVLGRQTGTRFRVGLLSIVTSLLLCGCIGQAEELRETGRVYVKNYGVDEEPQYGGTLRVGTVYVTLNALSWDATDWNWKLNHDSGSFAEQLFRADLEKSQRFGGPYSFQADAWIPDDALIGELAESWEWEEPLTLVVRLRRGVMFPDKPGVMEARELSADDVVFSYEMREASPKRQPAYFEHIKRVSARDAHTVVFEFHRYNADWAFRFGYGYYSAILPVELANVDAKDWRNATGTGPLQLVSYVGGNKTVFKRNPDYWGTATWGGREYQLPYIDQLEYRIVKDEATYQTALRTGKIDILEAIRWLGVDHLKKTTPELQWNRFLSFTGAFLALRMDQAPFDDGRVRRALNLAVNNQEIVDLFYGGHAEIFGWPQHPDYEGYFEPLEEMPADVRELYSYQPEKAKRLLAEAGYADGFDFKMQVCTCDPGMMDIAPLLADAFSQIGVRAEIEPMEYSSHLSVMTSSNHGPGYLVRTGHVRPTRSLRKNFLTGHLWNISKFSDPEIDLALERLLEERDGETRKLMVKDITRSVLTEAPSVLLPAPYVYTAWWPWVKNYNGELRAGAVRPGPIYAQAWIDQELKKELGF